MKLDRNTNPDGRGKYALIQMRELKPEQASALCDVPTLPLGEYCTVKIPTKAIRTGAESPGDQFFVIKYKDRFAAAALNAYARAVMEAAIMLEAGNPERESLIEYATEMAHEALLAEKAGCKIPD